MLGLALASLRRRKRAVAGGFLALLCAAAMTSACGVLLETGLRGPIEAQRYAGTPVVVTADQQIHWTQIKHKHGKTKTKTKSKDLTERAWLSPSIGTRLHAIAGASVVADVSFPAQLVLPGGRIGHTADERPTRGHDWASTRMAPDHLVDGAPPRSSDDVVLDRRLAARYGVAVGDRVRVQSTSSPHTYTVTGLVLPPASVTTESGMFFAGSEATRLSGHGVKVAAYGVFGVSARRVADALRGTGAQTSTGEKRGAAEFHEAASARTGLISMAAAIGGTSLIVAAIVVVGTFTVSTRQRYRELALLRAVGATPRQVRRLVRREALVLGVLAAVPGALAGLELAVLIRAAFVSRGTMPDTLQLARGPMPVAVAALATLAAAVAAAAVSSRRIARIRPAQALTEATVERRSLGSARSAAGVATAAGAAGVTALLTTLHTAPAAMPVTYLAIVLWMVAVSLLGPWLARLVIAILGVAAQASPVGGFLGTRSSLVNPSRVASAVTPLAMLIGMTATLLFVPTTIGSAAEAQAGAGTKAERVVTSTGAGVPVAAVHQLRATPGVRAAVEVVRSTIWIGRHKHSAQGITIQGIGSVIDPGVTSGSLRHLRHGTIAMSARAAQGRSVGDTVQVTLGDGTKASLKLIAIYDRGLGFGDTLVSFGTLDHHVDTPGASAALVRGSITSQQLRARLRGFPGLHVHKRSDYLRTVNPQQTANAAVNLIFMALIAAYVAIAVVNTLVMSTMDRARELSLLRVVGGTVRQVGAGLGWELAFIMAIAAVLGSAAAWLTLTGFSIGMVGHPAPSIRPFLYLAVLAGAAALGVLGLLVPARLILRHNPADSR